MELAAEILAWSETQPLWRRDLMRRLTVASELTDAERAEVLDALVAAHVGPTESPDLRPLMHTDLPQFADTRVKLVYVADLDNVNGLADGQTLTFGAMLNVIYGGTGAGKTGYARIFKRACRAVDREELLGNVYSGKTAPPRATIRIAGTRGEKTFQVDLTQPGPPELSTVSVFDGRCAEVYATGDTLAMTPAPLGIFDRLARTQLALREIVDERIAALDRRRPSFSDIPADTKARRIVDGLAATTGLAAVCAFASLDATALDRLATLEVELAQVRQSGPDALAARAEREATALANMITRVEQLEQGLGAAALERIATARAAVVATADAVELARTGAFVSEPLAATGSPGWRVLWDAARHFAEYDCGVSFPPREREPCPFCQQPIGAEAAARLAQFDAFVLGAVEREAAKARERLAAQTGAIERLRAQEVEELPGVAIVAVEDGELALTLKAFLAGATGRARALTASTASDDVPSAPTEALRRLLSSRRDFAARQRALVDPDKQRVLVTEAKELRARHRLGERLDDVRAWHTCLVEAALLQRVRRALDTTAISTKQRELTAVTVTDELRRRIREELHALGFTGLEVDLDCRGNRGQTRMRTELIGADAAPQRVFSTGEQRAVSLAFFLAEVACSRHAGPIVVDDPTLGFAPEHRRHFARRLIEECARRQVVVLTHDLALVWELEQRAESAGVDSRSQCLRHVAGRPGVVRPDLPWVAARVKQRRGDLNARLQALEKMHRTGDERYDDEAHLYVELLRETWERSFEEKVLNGAVTRFDPAVHTQQLAKSAVDAEFVTRIDAGMTETSQWVHDQPRGGHATVPSPDELKEALAHLDEFLTLVAKGTVAHIQAA